MPSPASASTDAEGRAALLASLLGSVGTGAVVGLSMGALGGMGYAVMRKGKDVVIPAQSRMSILIDQPVNITR